MVRGGLICIARVRSGVVSQSLHLELFHGFWISIACIYEAGAWRVALLPQILALLQY